MASAVLTAPSADGTTAAMSNAQSPGAAPVSHRVLIAWLVVLWAAMFGIAVSGYPNLLDNERRVGAYVLEVIQNHHWIIQRDATGTIASKPPMLTWIASLSTLCFGEVNRFSIYLPSALATLGVTLLIFSAGRKHFGWRAGFIAALAYLLSYVADKQVVTARYDGVFSFPVLLAALAAYSAWTTGRGWTAFWLAATLATMVKGPLGLVLAASGLLAVFWERRSGNRVPLRGSHFFGIVIFLLICGGWLLLAYNQLGQPLIAKMFGRELVGHLVQERERTLGQGFWEPVWNTFTNFLPWSIVAPFAFWRVVKRPATNIDERQFERFLFCWVMASIILFSIAAHQRGRLAWPLVPAISLLIGRQLDQWLARMTSRRVLAMAGALTALTLIGLTTYHHVLQRRSRAVQETLLMKSVAAELKQLGPYFPLTYTDVHFAAQFFQNRLQFCTRLATAAELLRQNKPAFVLVARMEPLKKLLGTNTTVHELRRWPTKGDPQLWLVSNQPQLVAPAGFSVAAGPVTITLDEARIEHASWNEFVFSSTNTQAEAVVVNSLSTPLQVQARWDDGVANDRTLAPGEKLHLTR